MVVVGRPSGRGRTLSGSFQVPKTTRLVMVVDVTDSFLITHTVQEESIVPASSSLWNERTTCDDGLVDM